MQAYFEVLECTEKTLSYNFLRKESKLLGKISFLKYSNSVSRLLDDIVREKMNTSGLTGELKVNTIHHFVLLYSHIIQRLL